MSTTKTTNIIIAALGGEGGGVLADWLTDVASSQGYIAQSTSVPGVAQRTGATIYYIELFPEFNNTDKKPVMSLFPTQGDIDIVVASEIIEAGRMLQRGFVTPNRTTLICSEHRVYAIGEKLVAGDGIVDASEVLKIAQTKSLRFIHSDMRALALEHHTVISATLFGALAGSGALPFPRAAFEAVIKHTGKAVSANLNAFAASYERVKKPTVHVVTPEPLPVFILPAATTAHGKQLLGRISNEFNSLNHEFLYLGVQRLLAYQDAAYANLYLDHLSAINTSDSSSNAELLRETARYLALWMAYEDIIRVAQIKISPQRFQRFSSEINIEPGQYYTMVEFLRPQVEEYVSILPPVMANYLLQSPFWKKFIGLFTKGKFVSTNKLSGFLQFYLLAKLKPLRKTSWGYQQEHTHINQWLGAVKTCMQKNTAVATELAKCGRLIKGYGATRKRSQAHMDKLLSAINQGKITQSTQIAEYRNKVLNDTLEQKISLNAH